MNIFKPRHMVCKECGVHYDRPHDGQKRWADLCPTHREPVMQLDLRKERVVRWLEIHWERMEKQMREEQVAELRSVR
jgi:hypothetical protein